MTVLFLVSIASYTWRTRKRIFAGFYRSTDAECHQWEVEYTESWKASLQKTELFFATYSRREGASKEKMQWKELKSE